MPIYEYRCASCGYQKEYLVRMSDAPLTVCPECSKETFRKMVTAAGFQLKGSGWYVTDFKNGPKAKSEPLKPAASAKTNEVKESKTESKTENTGGSAGTGAAATGT